MNLNNRIVYIAGPISGRLDTYKQEFAEAEKHLVASGAVVLNPAVLPLGLKSHQSYMNICLPMLREADNLVLLAGWEASEGAMLEVKEARTLGMPIFEFVRMPSLVPLPVPANDNVPASERNDWFERGELPPVGVVCQFFSAGYDGDWFDWCIFHGLATCGGFIIEHHHRTSPEMVTVTLFDPALTKFRPVRTERDVAACGGHKNPNCDCGSTDNRHELWCAVVPKKLRTDGPSKVDTDV